MPHTFHPSIIREYDIRGIVGKTLYPEDALALGKAFGTMVLRAGGMSVAVGYDGRTHSPLFEAELVKGLTSTGVRVIRIGLGPTPMLYFAVFHGNFSAGIMVTGSHNPSDQNGFKMLMSKNLRGGGPVYGDAIKNLAIMAAKDDFAQGAGSVKSLDLCEAYITRMLQDLTAKKPLKVVWDCGNGAGGDIVQRLVSRLPGEHILLFSTIDGTFPNHHPDPTVPENLQDLIKEVRDHGADLGIAFDGDADRIGAVDHLGRIVAGDQLLSIYAAEVLTHHKGAAIIADVKASQTLFDRVRDLGGQAIMWKTGHSLIKVKMAETNSPLAGEMSGHIFFADHYYGFDDAIYAGLRLMNIVANSGKTLAEWRDILPPTCSTPELRFPVDESRKFAIVDDIKAHLRSIKADMDTTDGVRVKTKDGWWLLRASNTQAVLVARAEAHDESGLNRLKESIKDELKLCGMSLPDQSHGH